MSEAFDWLEANLDDPAPIDAPDEAIDQRHHFLMEIDDDPSLTVGFPYRPGRFITRLRVKPNR